MKLAKRSLLTLVILTLALACLALGCSKQEAESTSTLVANTSFSAPNKEALPTRYQNVSGVALYSISNELREQLALLGAKAPMGIDSFFVLLSPKNPTEGILVKSPTPMQSLQDGLSNHTIYVTGNLVLIDQPKCAITDHFLEKYGFTLACDSTGRAAYIEAEQINDPDSQSSAPDAAASPAASPRTVELIKETTPLSATDDNANGQEASEPELLPDITTAPEAKQVESHNVADVPPTESSAPQDPERSSVPHRLSVTPIASHQAPAAAPAEPAAPSQPAAASATTSESVPSAPAQESADNAAVPEAIAPTAQPLSSAPAPQDVAPTSNPLQ